MFSGLIFVLSVGDFMFKVAPKHSPKVLSGLRCKKPVMCFTEKIHVLYELHLDMNYTAVGHKFKINKLPMYIT